MNQGCVASAESIDSLLGVTNPVALLDKVAETVEYLQLFRIGILELIHENILDTLADFILNDLVFRVLEH